MCTDRILRIRECFISLWIRVGPWILVGLSTMPIAKSSRVYIYHIHIYKYTTIDCCRWLKKKMNTIVNLVYENLNSVNWQDKRNSLRRCTMHFVYFLWWKQFRRRLWVCVCVWRWSSMLDKRKMSWNWMIIEDLPLPVKRAVVLVTNTTRKINFNILKKYCCR